MNGELSYQGKTLLLVNTGSVWQRVMLQKLKKLGLRIIALHREKNWAQPYVDEWILIDPFNHTEVLDTLRSVLDSRHLHVDGALTFVEDDLPLLARVHNELKLPGNSPDAVLLTRDKGKMQERLRQCGLFGIEHVLLRSKADLELALQRIGFPAVVKPISGINGQFVLYVSDEEEAREAYRYVLKNCTPEYDPVYRYNRRLFLYQEYVEGPEVRVECYCQHGIPHIVGMHEKNCMRLPSFQEAGHYSPPGLDDVREQELRRMVKEALVVLGLKEGLASVDVKIEKSHMRVLEVSCCMGKEYVYENILALYRSDLVRIAAEIALGVNVGDSEGRLRGYIVGRRFLPEVSGIITKMRGVGEVEKDGRVVSHFFGKKVGDSVFSPPDGYEAMGWLTVRGHSYTDAENALEHIARDINIEVAPFRSTSSMGKTLRKHRFASAFMSRRGMERLAKIRRLKHTPRKYQRGLHVGVVGNVYDESADPDARDTTAIGREVEETLKHMGYRTTFFDFNTLQKAFEELRESDVDIVFNVCESLNNTSLLEPHAASLFDILQMPYTGSSTFTLSLSLDKIRVKKLLDYHTIPTPRWGYLYSLDEVFSEDLRYPLIVKPANTHGSVGITNKSVVRTPEELREQVRRTILEIRSPVLVEEYIDGDEFDVTIMGNVDEDVRVLPLCRWGFQDFPDTYWHILPYDAKWAKGTVYDKLTKQQPPKNLSNKLESLITEISLDAYRILDCHDYGRVELRVDVENNPYIVDINPNPALGRADPSASAAGCVGMDYGGFLEEIIEMTIKRYRNKPPYEHLQAHLL